MRARGFLRRLAADWAGLPDVPGIRRWVWSTVLDAIGTGMRLPVTALYLTAVVGLPLTSVGIGLGVAALVGTVCGPVVGVLIDRFGPKRMVIAIFLIAATGYFGYLGVWDWTSFVVVASVAEVAEHSTRPTKQAFVATMVTAEQRGPLMGFQRSVRNIGFGLGGLVLALLLTIDADSAYHAVLAADGASFLVAAVVVAGIPVAAATGRAKAPAAKSIPVEPKRIGYRAVLADRRYVALGVLNTLVLTQMAALNIGLPLWVNQHTSAPPGLLGVLFVVNTALVVVLQVRATKGVARASQTPPVYCRAAIGFVAAALAYWAAGQVGAVAIVVALLVIAVLGHTLSEVYGIVGEWTVSTSLAPEHLRGRYLSAFSISFSAQQAIGPVLVTFLMATAPNAAWFVLAALLAAGCVASAWLARDAKEPNESDQDRSPIDDTSKEASAIS
jgi:MFS family permease